jgi:RHS repeat-associated protein
MVHFLRLVPSALLLLGRKKAALLGSFFPCAFILSCLVGVAASQVDPAAGVLPFSTQQLGVDLATGTVHVSIPVRSKVGKIPFSFSLEGNFDIFKYVIPTGGTPQWWENASLIGQPGQAVSWGAGKSTCGHIGGTLYDLYVLDGTGAQHFVGGDIPCAGTRNFTGTASDGSGYTLVITGSTSDETVIIYDKSGNAVNISGGSTPWSVTDPDGATIKASGTSPVQYTDSLAQPAVAINYTGNFNYTYSYADDNGNTQMYTYTAGPTYNWVTNFACQGTNDSNYSNWFTLPASITTPTGEKYTFSYEQTPGYGSGNTTGRLTQITYPSGGSISYAYSGGNNGINCNSGVVPTLTVTVNDRNGNVKQWAYTNSNNSLTPGNFTVTVKDPANNNTVYSFSGDYQTQRQVYEGAVAPANLLLIEITCYNGNFTNCAAPSAVPSAVTQTDKYTYSGSSTSPSLQETKYDKYGNVIELKKYDFGAAMPPTGNPVSDTTISYDGENGVSCGTLSSLYMFDRPCSVTTVNASGTTVSQELYTYNATGHVIETQRLVSGSTYLTSYASYNSTGTVATSTDVNSAVTSYYYNGTGGCNDFLLTSKTLPVAGLSTSQEWNCSGGVLTQIADANSQTTKYGYVSQSGNADPLWRRLSITDPLGNITWNTYMPASQTAFATRESALTFNSGNSTADVLATADGLNRSIYSQQRQGPEPGTTTFDSTQVAYGWTVTTSTVPGGPFTTKSVPYSGTAGQAAPSGTAITTTQLDALNRPLTVVDGGGGTTTYTYVQNDVRVTVSPAPVGENTKARQYQYDGLGRLTSVCEITSAAGSGSCGQSNPATGFLTQYTYDALGDLITVTQNAQPGAIGGAQTRTYVYDGVRRLTSEVNPESGTTLYFYDAAPSSPGAVCPGPFNGDLVKRYDASGNTTCSAYDGLHRVTSKTYSGPNPTTNRYFVYDSATVDGQTMTNAKERLAEGYTATCSTCTKLTDEGFSYTTRGELTNFYESTPNSAGYYSVPMTYWANGQLEMFGPFLNEQEINISLDGEGRPYTITGGAQNITYNTASQPTQLMTSCAGTTCYPINYSYDPNTLRMKEYSAALSTGTVSGTLTWNPNGSLQQLVIADPKNSADSQTCTYSADDLGRIASTSCGSTWAQTFSYDAFGNITKSGSGTWMPGYNTSTNHYALAHTSYDSDGNILNDSFNAYTWDAEGKPLSTAYGTGETWAYTYDAFGHMAELWVDGTYRYSYIKLGKFKLAATGQTAGYSETPLPGGSIASQNGGATGVQLADWLGTIRAFYSYTGGTEGSSGAHAPFGEAYATNWGYPQGFTGQGGPGWGNGGDGSMSNTTYWFPERQYRSSQGRWLSPDPVGLGAVNASNPQSWNRYAYVVNNPLSVIDPRGLSCEDPTDGQPCIVNVTAPPPPDVPLIEIEYDPYYGWINARVNTLKTFLRQISAKISIKRPGQTWKQCMEANSSTYSIGGSVELGANVLTGTNTNYSSNPIISGVTGNAINTVLFGDSTAEAGATAAANTPELVSNTMGSATTYGRRTTDIMSLNLEGTPGGPPLALSQASGGVKGALEDIGDTLSFGLSFVERTAVDAAFTGAEAIDCGVPSSN